MRRMIGRGLFYGLATAGVLASSAAQAEVRCASASDQDAFEVGALKSQLIVLAETCPGADKTYNAFVERYRSELVAEDKVVNAWFKRTFGGAAQRQYDVFITDLINQQSQIGLKQGSNFCPRSQAIFAEAMSLPDTGVLPQYAAGKNLIPPELGSCSAAPAPVAAKAGRAKRR